MSSLPDDITLKETHQPGLKGLLRVYDKGKLGLSLIIPVIVTVLFLIGISISDQNVLNLVTFIVDQVLSIMPDLLGFVLGGYAILIGFGNEKFLASTSEISEDKPISFYQTFSSIFAVSILSMAIALVFAYIVSLISSISTPLFITNETVNCINYSSLIVLLFSSVYSVCQIPVLILNIFGFSQMFHINMIAQNLNKKSPKKD